MVPFPGEVVFGPLTDYGAVVAEDLDRVRICVEDAHLHGRSGEQEPEDAAPEVPELRVRQVGISRDEPLKEKAQRNPQGESEDDAAYDQEVEGTPAEIEKSEREGSQE